jgi:F0F1-type ATP synthase assembly protein I
MKKIIILLAMALVIGFSVWISRWDSSETVTVIASVGAGIVIMGFVVFADRITRWAKGERK